MGIAYHLVMMTNNKPAGTMTWMAFYIAGAPFAYGPMNRPWVVFAWEIEHGTGWVDPTRRAEFCGWVEAPALWR